MSIIADVIIIIISFAIFGYLHSWLASNELKEKLKNKLGNLIAFYRLAYNILALVTFYLLFIWIPSDISLIKIYDLTYPYDIIILIPQFAGLLGLIWSIRYFSLKEFLGLNQILRWFKNEYNKEELDEKLTFRIKGPYKYIRHPVYFFAIVFLLFRPEIDLFYLTILLCIIAYFYIGSIYEEKKLIAAFGEDYLKYQQEVPRIFPVKIKKK